MDVRSVREQVSAWLDDYLESLGMTAVRGPLRAAGRLTRGIIWTGSVQFTNAARQQARNPKRLARIVKGLSHHFGKRKWDPRRPQKSGETPAFVCTEHSVMQRKKRTGEPLAYGGRKGVGTQWP